VSRVLDWRRRAAAALVGSRIAPYNKTTLPRSLPTLREVLLCPSRRTRRLSNGTLQRSAGRLRLTEALLGEYISDEVLRRHILAFEAAFPRYELAVEGLVAEGDYVALRGTFRGTHQADFRGAAPTGRSVTFPLQITYEIAAGKIAKHWLVADSLSMAQQVGLVPAPAGPAS
jgi:predicted ester cyclase